MSNNNDLNQTPPTESELLTSLEKVGEEWKSWIISIGLAAIVVLSVVLYRSHNANNEEKASQMLGEAVNMQSLQSLMRQYPKTSAAQLALLQTAKAQYDNRDFIAAQVSYQEFLAQNPTHAMAAFAELGKVHCMEGLGNTEAALTAFTQFASKNPNHFLTPMAVFGKARCLQDLKRYAEARATYEDFLAANPKNAWESDVNEALRQLASEARRPNIKM